MRARTKTIIVFSGTREPMKHWHDRYKLVEAKLTPWITRKCVIRVGDCPTGVDAAVREVCEKYARARSIEVFHADWDQHGRSAGPIRNAQMISGADVLYAFPIAGSRGTRNAIELALREQMEIHVYPLERT